MPTVMAAADVVIGRAGSATCNEIAAAGVPCILIPSPNVTANHQYKNAKVLLDAGAAALFEEKELETTEAAPLTEKVAYLLSEQGAAERRAMEEKIRAFAVPDANKRIYLDLLDLVKKKKK